ncbi:MAG: hypothetical protein AAGF31_03545 [Planctomycetota bacterium]
MKSVFLHAYALTLMASVASAHGPQIQATNDGGKITTRQVLIGSYTPLTPETTVYVAPIGEVADFDFGPSLRALPDENPHHPFGPGVAYGLGGTFPANSTLTLTFVDELLQWDGGSFVSAGPTELAALRTSNPNGASLTGNVGISGSADPSVEVAIGASYGANAHASVTYVLLGDGVSPTSPTADGIYLAELQLSSSDAAIAPSDPFFLMLAKGSTSMLSEAVTSLGVDPAAVQFLAIPEPASLTLMACMMLVGWSSRERRT